MFTDAKIGMIQDQGILKLYVRFNGKRKTMKKSMLITGLLAAMGFSSLAAAHDYVGTLGTAATATDKFYITCATGTAKMTYQIRRNFGTPRVKTNMYSPAGAVALDSAAAGVFGPVISVKTGGGAKFFQVNKQTATSGADGYTLRAHCYDAANLHNPGAQPSSVTYIQNQ